MSAALFLVGPLDYVRCCSARKYFHPSGTFPGNSVTDILLQQSGITYLTDVTQFHGTTQMTELYLILGTN